MPSVCINNGPSSQNDDSAHQFGQDLRIFAHFYGLHSPSPNSKPPPPLHEPLSPLSVASYGGFAQHRPHLPIEALSCTPLMGRFRRPLGWLWVRMFPARLVHSPRVTRRTDDASPQTLRWHLHRPALP